jgi:hypothetical protein
MIANEPGTPPDKAVPPAPAAFHLGAGHRIVHANPAFIEAFGEAAVGQPAREALLSLPPKAFALMDLVFATGKAGVCQIPTDEGPRRFVVAPRRDPETGDVYGVTTHYRWSVPSSSRIAESDT